MTVWILIEDRFLDHFVHGIAGEIEADLIFRFRIVALDEAHVGRAGSDVYKERVANGIDVVRVEQTAFFATAEDGEEIFPVVLK